MTVWKIPSLSKAKSLPHKQFVSRNKTKIIAAQAVRIEALEKENSQLRQQVVELQKENSDLKRVVETLIHRIEFLEAKH
jgi:predicted RNase H-like nuclease (RuvC/YqgF family)